MKKGTLFSTVKQQGRGADQSHSCSAQVMSEWSSSSTHCVLSTLILPLLCYAMNKQQIVSEKPTSTDVVGIIIQHRTCRIINISDLRTVYLCI